MTFDLWAGLFYFLNGMISAAIMIKIRSNNIPGWATFIPSFAGMVLWSLVVKRSKLPVVELSALYDVLGAVAYFVGFALYGEKITPIQWCGISTLLFSLYLINK
jgi:drug/metabolite transporter (DMT)-like permease